MLSADQIPTECDKKDLFGKDIEDKHNPENEFQGRMCYGYFDKVAF